MLRRIINGPLASRNWWQCTSDPNLEFIKFISWQIRLQKNPESYLSGFIFGQTYKHLYKGCWSKARKERILEWVSERRYTDGKCCMSFYILGIWGGCWEELGRLWEEASVGSWKEGWSELTEGREWCRRSWRRQQSGCLRQNLSDWLPLTGLWNRFSEWVWPTFFLQKEKS